MCYFNVVKSLTAGGGQIPLTDRIGGHGRIAPGSWIRRWSYPVMGSIETLFVSRRLQTVFSLSWSLSRSWVLTITVSVLVLVLLLLCWSCASRPRQFRTPDRTTDETHHSMTHCHYQLVDVQRFCYLIRLHSFGHIRHLVLDADRKRTKRVRESWRQNGFDNAEVMGSLEKVFSLSLQSLGLGLGT